MASDLFCGCFMTFYFWKVDCACGQLWGKSVMSIYDTFFNEFQCIQERHGLYGKRIGRFLALGEVMNRDRVVLLLHQQLVARIGSLVKDFDIEGYNHKCQQFDAILWRYRKDWKCPGSERRPAARSPVPAKAY